MHAALIMLLLFPQYVRKPFHNGRELWSGGKAAWTNLYYEVPLTLDTKGEATIRYDSLYPGERYTQACQPDERRRDKKVRFFSVEEDAAHVRVGTEPQSPGMKVLYVCTIQVPHVK